MSDLPRSIDDKEIRKKAWSVYKDNFLTLAAISVIVTGMSYAISEVGALVAERAIQSAYATVISYLLELVLILITAPLSFGFLSVLVKCAGGSKPQKPFGEFFGWYADGKKIKASVLASLWYTVIKGGWIFIYTLAASAALLISAASGSLLLMIAAFAFLIFMLLSALAKILTYAPGSYVIAEDHDRWIIETYQRASLAMRTYKWEVVGMFFKLIPLLLPFIILAIPEAKAISASLEEAARAADPSVSVAILKSMPDYVATVSRILLAVYEGVMTPYLTLCLKCYFDKVDGLSAQKPEKPADFEEDTDE